MSFFLVFQVPEMKILLTMTDTRLHMYSRSFHEISMMILGLVLASTNLLDLLLLSVLAVASNPVLHSTSVQGT